MKHLLSSAIIACLSLSVWAQQDTIYLNANREFVKRKSKAKECALVRKIERGIEWVDFYTLDGKPTASSQYRLFGKTPDYQILHGTTRYLYRESGQDSLQVDYQNNCRTGDVTFYYPGGEVMAKGRYKNGVLNDTLRQFYENGALKRIEVHKKNKCTYGKCFAPDGTEISHSPFYQPARFEGGEAELARILGRAAKFPAELYEEMNNSTRRLASKTASWPDEMYEDVSKNSQKTINVLFGIVVNAHGKAVDILTLKTEDPRANASHLEGLLDVLGKYTFIPGEIDNRKCTTLVVVPLRIQSYVTVTKTRL